jgi:hypothetical protein
VFGEVQVFGEVHVCTQPAHVLLSGAFDVPHLGQIHPVCDGAGDTGVHGSGYSGAGLNG